MHILVINDDGPPSPKSSPYIHSFVKSLQDAGHTVSVILPHQQRSWIGKAHFVGQVIKPTYFRPDPVHQDSGTINPRPSPSGTEEEGEWVLVDGTPASCAQLGLFHFFQHRGPVDLVISGPNYGRNCTSLFILSSGTIGGAMEAALCRKKAIALSFAFDTRIHDSALIAAACRHSVKVAEHLHAQWESGVDLYSVNVPLRQGVEKQRVMVTEVLQNYWGSGSSFMEVEDEGERAEPEVEEREIRQRAEDGEGSEREKKEEVSSAHQHRWFKWAPSFTDVHASVDKSAPGNDGWTVREGCTSVTPLKANFMHVPTIPSGEIKL